MEFLIGLGIGIVIAAITSGKKKQAKKEPAQVKAETAQEREARETDELITTILPTIENDK